MISTRLLRILTGAGALLLAPLTSLVPAAANDQPIQLIIGFAPGGPTDVVARVVAAKMGEILSTSVVIENRVGASGNIASEQVARSAPDGRTLLMAPTAFAVNETLFPQRRFAYEKNFVAVAPLASTSNVLVVHPSLPVNNMPELLAWAKTQSEVFYATAGRGTVTDLAGALFGEYSGVKMVPVHYKGGGDLLNDILSGQVKITFSTIPPVLEFVNRGNLRGLATTALARNQKLSTLPTLDEAGLKGYEMQLWLGLLAPNGTPRPVVEALAKAANQAVKDPAVKASLEVQDFVPMQGNPDQFDAFVRDEIKKWGSLAVRVRMTE